LGLLLGKLDDAKLGERGRVAKFFASRHGRLNRSL